jgi:hypothetical protein
MERFLHFLSNGLNIFIPVTRNKKPPGWVALFASRVSSLRSAREATRLGDVLLFDLLNAAAEHDYSPARNIQDKDIRFERSCQPQIARGK